MDAMRAVAAIMVAASHIRDLIMVDYEKAEAGALMRAFYFATGFGHAGVVVFFVLSGFWITKSVVRRANNDKPFWRSFLIDRLSRLWLVLVPVLILGGLLDWCGSRILLAHVYTGQSGALSLSVPITLAPSIFLGNVLFLQNIFSPVFGSNGPLWSLAYEFWYYLWFPALYLAAQRRFSLAMLTLLVFVFAPSVLVGFGSWLCGSLLYALTERFKCRSYARLLGSAALLLGLLASASMLGLIRLRHWWWLDPALACCFATLLLGLCLLNLRLPGIRSLANYGAKSSFSLYAFHFPAATFVAALLLHHGRLASGPRAVSLVLAVLLVVILLGYLLSLVTEAHTARVRSALSVLLPGAPPPYSVGIGAPKRNASFTRDDMTARLDDAT